ncbi:MAG: SIMPL domain-containing protein [Caulobacterales bacterium]
MRALAAVAAIAAMTAAAPMAVAQDNRQAPPPGAAHVAPMGTMLSISAEGKSTARPDMGTINLGVQTDGATAAAALAENSRRMNALIAALRRAGVAERDIQTSNISVNPQYVYEERQPPRLTGYQASNTVTAKVRNIDRIGAVIDAAVAAGGNTVNGVSFSHQNPDAQLDAARTDAIEEARRRAGIYARAVGMSVGRIVSISEGGGYSPPIPMPMYARADVANAAAPPVAPGEIDTTINVAVVFELR